MTNKKDIKRIPKMRFPEFDGDWDRFKLSEISTFGSGGTPSKDNMEYWGGKIPWISASSMQGHLFSESELMITKLGLSKGSKLAKKGTILLLVRGSMLYNKIPVGITGIDVAFNQDVKSITVDYRSTAPFILQWFLAKQNLLLNMVVGTGIGAGKLDTHDLNHILTIIPLLPEQKKIADFLSAVDKKIAQLTTKKQLLEQYKQGLMQKIFSQQIRFKDENGNHYPAWQEKKLEEVASFSKGKGISKADVEKDGKYECIRYGELYTLYSEIISKIHSCTNADALELTLSRENDVIIPSSGETHIDLATASCVAKEGVALGGDINIIRTKQNGIFLAYYLNNAKRNHIARLAQGSSVIHLYSNHLKILKLSLPSLPEQQKIASLLTNIDQKITAVQKQLTQTQTFKKGLLQQLFI